VLRIQKQASRLPTGGVTPLGAYAGGANGGGGNGNMLPPLPQTPASGVGAGAVLPSPNFGEGFNWDELSWISETAEQV
jgi:hypothetical protein